jgi:hypothetical protein
MDDGEKSKGTWWQTAPGILTAIAGVITAVAGLFVTLHQIGLLGNKEKSSPPSPPSINDIAKPTGVKAPAATLTKEVDPSKVELPSEVTRTTIEDHARQYSFDFPSGTEVALRSSRANGIYKVLSAQVDSRNSGRLTLKISVRLTNLGRSDLGFWSDSFRLKIDGIPRAPINFLNQLVEAQSAKEGDVLFEVPDTAERLVLFVKGDAEGTADISILMKKLP